MRKILWGAACFACISSCTRSNVHPAVTSPPVVATSDTATEWMRIENMSLASTIDSLSIAGTMYHFAAVGVESNRYINVATANSTTVVIYVTYSPATSSELVIFPNANSSAFSNYPFPNGMEGMAVKDSAIFYNQNISDESAIDLVAE